MGSIDLGIKRILWGGAFLFAVLLVFTFLQRSGRIPFLTQNVLSLVVLVVIAIQAHIYRGQWGAMERQWKAMEDNLDRTDKMIATMQGQLETARDEVEMAKGQLVAMQSQKRALYESLEESRKLVAQNERAVSAAEANVQTVEKTAVYANRAYVVAKIRDTGPYDDLLMFRLRIVNNGNTPANEVVVRYGFGLRETPPHEEKPDGLVIYDEGFTETERLGLVAATGSYHVISTPTVPIPYPITTAEYKLWESGESKFYCWGQIIYEDIFQQKRRTEFCFVLSPLHPQGDPCKHGNAAD